MLRLKSFLEIGTRESETAVNQNTLESRTLILVIAEISESSLGAQPLCWLCHVAAQIIFGNWNRESDTAVNQHSLES